MAASKGVKNQISQIKTFVVLEQVVHVDDFLITYKNKCHNKFEYINKQNTKLILLWGLKPSFDLIYSCTLC